MANKFYLTTTLPYVNAKPHIGFALEIVQADAIARYRNLLGDNVFFNFGTDEHGQKIYQKALDEGKEPQDYVDEYAEKFDGLKTALNLSYNNFIRTTDPHHKSAAQELWKRCFENGYIEKGIYKAKYCVGCELEKQDSELTEGKCPLHPTLEIEIIEEENYFFKFSSFGQKLLDLYNKYPDFVTPEHRLKEISNFVSSGLEDFSVSRLKEKMPWGVPVPGDDKHVMYVWFDALTNYISALGWPEDTEKFEEFWGTTENPKALQVAGKDNLRQQSSMWQAMLLAADLPTTRRIFIHGFITSGGQKMSKSLGNVIDPIEYVEKYGTDALRYYLLAKINPTEDSDFTEEKFKEVYNGDLANGLGNLVARVAAMATSTEGYQFKLAEDKTNALWNDVETELLSYSFNEALSRIWGAIKGTDAYLSQERPWQLDLSDENQRLSKYVILTTAINNILEIAYSLQPFLPETAEKIQKQFSGQIKSGEALFPRLQ
jgi:methionyl-tRNA synthetase